MLYFECQVPALNNNHSPECREIALIYIRAEFRRYFVGAHFTQMIRYYEVDVMKARRSTGQRRKFSAQNRAAREPRVPWETQIEFLSDIVRYYKRRRIVKPSNALVSSTPSIE